MGAGRTEFAMSLFGQQLRHAHLGHGLQARQGDQDPHGVARRSTNGLAYATEDRKNYGLNLIDDIKRNISLASLASWRRPASSTTAEEYKVANEYRKSMNIKAPNVLAKTGKLSGGNQQKVVLSKWIYSDPDVLILDEPTRGIDVGAKYEIYTIINQLAAEGKGVIVISSELPELLGICDRIYALSEGRITGELPDRRGDPRSPPQAHDHGTRSPAMSAPSRTQATDPKPTGGSPHLPVSRRPASGGNPLVGAVTYLGDLRQERHLHRADRRRAAVPDH